MPHVTEDARAIFFEELVRRARDEFPTAGPVDRIELHIHLTSALMLGVLTDKQVTEIYDTYIFPVQKEEACRT